MGLQLNCQSGPADAAPKPRSRGWAHLLLELATVGATGEVHTAGTEWSISASLTCHLPPHAPAASPHQTNLVTASPEDKLSDAEAKLKGIEGMPVVDAAGKASWPVAWGVCRHSVHGACVHLHGPSRGSQVHGQSAGRSPGLWDATSAPKQVHTTAAQNTVLGLQLVGVLSKKDLKKGGELVKVCLIRWRGLVEVCWFA